MSSNHSDALVFFGATGDLAYKKIFPALQGMVKRGNLDARVIGVARVAMSTACSASGARQARTTEGSMVGKSP